jgi:hypothetical protein
VFSNGGQIPSGHKFPHGDDDGRKIFPISVQRDDDSRLEGGE